MFQDVCLTSIQALCQLENCISAPSQSHITPSTSQDVHLNSIQVPSQPIQVSRFVSPLHPGSQIHVSSLSQLNLTSIWVLIFTSHPHPGYISPPSRSTKLHLHSIQASCQTHTGFNRIESIKTTSIGRC